MWQRGFGGPLGGLRVLNLSGNAALGAFRGNLSDRILRLKLPFPGHVAARLWRAARGLRVLNLSGNAALGAFRGNLSDRILRLNIAPCASHSFVERLFEVLFVSVLGLFGCV
jgi:hypothetical protein